jgi:hypothetical protein
MGSKLKSHDEAQEITRAYRAKLAAGQIAAPVFEARSTHTELSLRRLRRRAGGWAREHAAPRRAA